MNEEAMLKIDAAIDEIENYVSEAHRVPLLEKVLVKDDELFHLMDNLRNQIPKEVNDALQVCHRRDEIINAAKEDAERIIEKANKEAQEIIDKAKLFAQKTVDENDLVIQAKEEAQNIQNQTEEDVKKLKEETTAWIEQQKKEIDAYTQQQRTETETYVKQQEAYVKQLKEDAERYAVQMFDHVVANMNSAINAIHNDVGNVMQAMNQAKEQIHSANKKV